MRWANSRRQHSRVSAIFLAAAGAVLLTSPALAQGAWPVPADLDKLCAGWAGKWRAEIDRSFTPGKGWGPSSEPPDWSVEQTAPGQCRFRFGGKLQFAIDTSKGFYDITPYEDGKLGQSQRGRVLQAELVDPKAWNTVVEVPAKAGTYRMQMTMADDVFAIYLTGSGADATRQPDGLAVHRRQ